MIRVLADGATVGALVSLGLSLQTVAAAEELVGDARAAWLYWWGMREAHPANERWGLGRRCVQITGARHS